MLHAGRIIAPHRLSRPRAAGSAARCLPGIPPVTVHGPAPGMGRHTPGPVGWAVCGRPDPGDWLWYWSGT
ncbi:hypothetical protein KTQ54_15990 [Komagataeibacter oboediens]|uniref:hypothetical protein n=1 Tax=Komagataeibacter oboediens TaxID=65958 RepID=UPI001C2CBB28|nr:hypothetical protein [Komagataeibacter oboediens]MBV0890002.1 hypothetical protein [Komagataeibacter oboediens]MCK9818974.1 hypothetical protein [Komagataeibacter oboediens]